MQPMKRLSLRGQHHRAQELRKETLTQTSKSLLALKPLRATGLGLKAHQLVPKPLRLTGHGLMAVSPLALKPLRVTEKGVAEDLIWHSEKGEHTVTRLCSQELRRTGQSSMLDGRPEPSKVLQKQKVDAFYESST